MFMTLITLIAGGTGGHVFPAIALGEEIEKYGKVKFITDQRTLHLFYEESDVQCISCRRPSECFWFFISIAINFFKFFIMFLKNRPKVVCGFGGYVSFSGIIAAWFLRIPTVIHEQNKQAGRVNRFLSIFATKTTTAFYETFGLKKKSIHVGMPIRNCIKESAKLSKQKKDKESISLLITGGSQGASIFSKIIPEAITMLSQDIKNKLTVYHQVRREDIFSVELLYQSNKLNYFELSPFFKNINEIYSNVDIVISRAGASSLFEAVEHKKPSIVIPFSLSKDNHQSKNASFFKNKDAIWVFDECDVNASEISNLLEGVFLDKSIINEKRENMLKIYEKKPSYCLVSIVKDLIQ